MHILINKWLVIDEIRGIVGFRNKILKLKGYSLHIILHVLFLGIVSVVPTGVRIMGLQKYEAIINLTMNSLGGNSLDEVFSFSFVSCF